MNAETSLIAIGSLLLALAVGGGALKDQAQSSSLEGKTIAPSRIALNHNETMLTDTRSIQEPTALSLTTFQQFFFGRPKPGGCDDWGCGRNHNETMVRDESLVAQPSVWSQWLSSVQSFFYTRRIPGGCDEWGCGTNHNETMVRDA